MSLLTRREFLKKAGLASFAFMFVGGLRTDSVIGADSSKAHEPPKRPTVEPVEVTMRLRQVARGGEYLTASTTDEILDFAGADAAEVGQTSASVFLSPMSSVERSSGRYKVRAGIDSHLARAAANALSLSTFRIPGRDLEVVVIDYATGYLPVVGGREVTGVSKHIVASGVESGAWKMKLSLPWENLPLLEKDKAASKVPIIDRRAPYYVEIDEQKNPYLIFEVGQSREDISSSFNQKRVVRFNFR